MRRPRVALTSSAGYGAVYRARGRELLARNGSLSRLPVGVLRVLPKVRTAPNGTSSRTLSRYVAVHAPGVDIRWYKTGARAGSDPRSEHATFLLLPWPLRVRESDFRPIEGSVRSLTKEPFGYFEFAPSEGLDLDLVERVLMSALDEGRARRHRRASGERGGAKHEVPELETPARALRRF